MLCGVAEDLVARGCPAGNIVDPQGETSTMGDSGAEVVSPESATVVVRPGIVQEFDVVVSPPESVPVDMYVLMDLSFTMKDHLANLARFTARLGQ